MGAKSRITDAKDTQAEQYPGHRIQSILNILAKEWGHAVCELDFKTPFELTVATILSAQSTDKRVNLVTPELFSRYPDAHALAQADLAEVETLVHSTGFFRNKAKNIVRMAQQVVADFDGEIPRTMREMTSLAGVARKTANVVLGTAYHIPSGFVVDTHIKRVANRLGLTKETNPVKIEQDLMASIPKERWIDAGHQMIWHGRRICHAKKPACNECALAPLCPSFDGKDAS